MKRFFAVMLVLCMIFGLCACDIAEKLQQPGSFGGKMPGQMKPIEQESEKGSVSIISCRFADEVAAADGEFKSMLYTEREDRVYVDVVMEVRTEAEMTEDDFSGYVMYEDQRYDMQYCAEGEAATSVNDNPVTAPGGRVHLFTLVPDAAEGTDLEAVVTVDGQEHTCEVMEKDTRAPLDKKVKLSVGDKESLADGAVEFEVVSCKYTKVLRAQDTANAKQYNIGGPFLDLVLKVTNHSQQAMLKNSLAYTVEGEDFVRGSSRYETENNTDLESFYEIGAGKTEYVHFIFSVEENQTYADTAIRFNLLGVTACPGF